MPLRSFLSLLVLACLAPLFVLTVWFALDHVLHIEQDLNRRLMAAATELAADVDRELESRIKGLQILAESAEATASDGHHSLYLRALAYRRVFATEVILTGSGPTMAFNTRAPLGSVLPLLPQPSGHSALASSRSSGLPAVGDPFMGPLAAEQLTAIVVPVPNADAPGRFLIATLAAGQISPMLDHAYLPEGARASLLGSRGQLIASTQHDALDPGSGPRTIRASRDLTRAPWSIVIEADPARRVDHLLVAVLKAGLALLVVAGIAWWAGVRASRLLQADLALLTDGAPAGQATKAPVIREVSQAVERLSEADRLREEAVAQRELANDKVRQSEALLSAVITQAGDAIFLADARSESEGYPILIANEAAGRLHRCAPSALIGRPIGAIVPEEQRAHFHDYLRQVMAAPDITIRHKADGDAQGLRADGSRFPVQASISSVVLADARYILVIGREVTELRQTRTELARSHQKLQELLAALNTAQEDERRRIARDLHDDLQQRLAAIRLELAAWRWGGPRADPTPTHAAAPMAVDKLIVDAIDASRRIVADLHPPALKELGLGAALRELGGQFVKLSGINLDLDLPDDEARDFSDLSAASTICLYRIAQEALNNIRKHAGAGFAHMSLQRAGLAQVELLISDDGRGIRAGDHDKPAAFGLQGVRERARAQGGTLHVEALRSGGTVLRVSIPITA